MQINNHEFASIHLPFLDIVFSIRTHQKTYLFHCCKKCSGLFIETAAVDHLIQNVRSTAALTRILSAHHFRGFSSVILVDFRNCCELRLFLFAAYFTFPSTYFFYLRSLHQFSPFPPSLPLPPPPTCLSPLSPLIFSPSFSLMGG